MTLSVNTGDSATTPLRLAVVGTGALGRHHARILSGFEDVDLVAVADPNEQNGSRIANEYGAKWVADYETILDSVDAVSIAAPTTLHHRIASAFLKRGIPTLVEKPLTNDLDDAAELVRLSQQTRTQLQVGHVERFNPTTRAAFEHAGSPRYIRSERVSPYAFRSTDIGVVHDLMIHDLDLVLDLVGSAVVDVHAFGVSVFGGNEDSVQARLTFQNGCIADLTASRVCPTPGRTMQIWSPTGCVTADFTSREVTRFAPTPAMQQGTPVFQRATQPNADVAELKAAVFGEFLAVEQLPVSDADALTAELRHFVDCARTGATPVCSGEEGRKALEVASRVLQSVAAHQWDGHAGGRVGPFFQIANPIRKIA